MMKQTKLATQDSDLGLVVKISAPDSGSGDEVQVLCKDGYRRLITKRGAYKIADVIHFTI